MEQGQTLVAIKIEIKELVFRWDEAE